MFAAWYGKFIAWYRKEWRRHRIAAALLNSERGVEIIGDDHFVRLTTEALDLLKSKVPDVYALLRKHVGCIVSSKPQRYSSRPFAACCLTYLLACAPTTAVLMRPYGSELPIETRAAFLAHEAYHAELYRVAQDGNPSRKPPRDAYSGERAETLCVAYECDVMRRLGVDEWDVQRFEQQLKTKWWESDGDGWDV